MTRRYKVLSGIHSEGKDKDGRALAYGKGTKLGDTFETEQDLSAHNVPGYPPRFQLLSNDVTPDDLMKKSKAELLALAEDDGIEADNSWKKEEIVEALKMAEASV